MISLDKKYRTRDGREARIYALDGDRLDQWPVHGAIKSPDGPWILASWRADGSCRLNPRLESRNDLIEVKPEVTVRKYYSLDRKDLLSWNIELNAMKYDRYLGAIDITHDGEKIVNVEIVR